VLIRRQSFSRLAGAFWNTRVAPHNMQEPVLCAASAGAMFQ
jgi:hypothetical protein